MQPPAGFWLAELDPVEQLRHANRHHGPAAPLADAGSPPAAAKNPRQRPLDILGQARGLSAARLDAVRARHRASLLAARPARPARPTVPEPDPGVRGFRGLADVPAVPALDLAEPPDQVHATADRAPVEVSCPVE